MLDLGLYIVYFLVKNEKEKEKKHTNNEANERSALYNQLEKREKPPCLYGRQHQPGQNQIPHS